MNISKISRSLIVVIFVAIVVFFGILDFKLLVGETQLGSNYTNMVKIGYALLVLILVLIYIYIKDKLYKMKIKRNVGLVYRYIYVSIIFVASRLLVTFLQKIDFNQKELIIYILISYITGIVVKKIIFNVSKSDMLSVFATFAYALLPFSLIDINKIIVSSMYTCVFFGCILALQILIDELKQRGIKTKKYLIEAAVLGILIGISTLFGISPLVWGIFAIFALFISSNLDNTHICFPKNIMSSITQSKREFLYKIERINISKLLVSILVAVIMSCIVFLLCRISLNTILNLTNDNYYISNIVENFNNIKELNVNKDLNFSSIIGFYVSFVGYSKTYYMILIAYILFMEILAVALRRRYDTKSTMMKLLFILIINSILIFNLNLELYQPLLTILLILIAIVNTSNIYLNREERIKMLVA